MLLQPLAALVFYLSTSLEPPASTTNSLFPSTEKATKMAELSSVSLTPPMKALVDKAKALYDEKLSSSSHSTRAYITTAPGRVNLIGEHTDYTQGFVFPLAIDFSTVVYGTGSLKAGDETKPSTANLKFLSAMNADKIVDEISIDVNTQPPEEAGPWTCYVTGVVAEYLKDIPSTGAELNLSFAISGDVPLGSGLSSSASLEVAVARFVECVLGDYAFTGENGPSDVVPEKVRAIRCQKAENLWCHSPCGIMDQYISSAASSDEKGTLLCIDCRTNDFEVIKMKQDPLKPVVLVVANSAVAHSIGGGEYPVRVQQCKAATEILQQVHGDRIKTLRDATVEDVLACEGKMDDVIYRRARHVVTENARVLATKEALLKGDYKVVGQQMNLSHVSMREDYENELRRSGYSGGLGSELSWCVRESIDRRWVWWMCCDIGRRKGCERVNGAPSKRIQSQDWEGLCPL
jgi:galactokinase